MRKNNIFLKFRDMLFPNTCICCGDIIDSGESLCYYCNEMLTRCDPIKRCFACGLTKDNCQCKHRVFRFDGCVSPFVNDGVAKKAMYAFKFGRRESYAEFFAHYMALSVKNEYRDITFDGIAYVPMRFSKLLKRGFNQSYVLANILGEILHIPVYKNSLKEIKKSQTQHKLPIELRFDNVKDLYKARYSIFGKTILLVDDIKTTGATLDACAAELYSAGAARVYCVTGLMTEKKKKVKK